MSYGTTRKFKTKAALKRYVEEVGAENVGVYGTSIFGNETAGTVAELADMPTAVIVGPSVETDRRWYANVKRRKDGRIIVV